MSIEHLLGVNPKQTPVDEPIPGSGQVPNEGGGYSWQVDHWKRLRRFLILGSEGGTYYATERKTTVDNVAGLNAALDEDPERTVGLIVEVSQNALAAKNDYAIYALAIACAHPKAKAWAFPALPKVCRIGTHLFMFMEFVKHQRGWGSGLRGAINQWLESKDVEGLAYQMVKYRQRHGWTWRDVLRVAHPKTTDPARKALYNWACGRAENRDDLPEVVNDFVDVQSMEDAKRVPTPVVARLPREALPTQWLSRPEVWDAMLPTMPLGAMVRNLGNMSRIGLLVPMSDAEKLICERLSDPPGIERSRIHPIQVLSAMAVYSAGRGMRGSGTWTPAQGVLAYLETAFYLSFKNVEPAGVNTFVALDVSSSMDWGTIAGVEGLNPRTAAAAMLAVTLQSEPFTYAGAFAREFQEFPVKKGDSVAQIVHTASRMDFGATNVASPMQFAARTRIPVDTFVIYTDNQVNCGTIHPHQALEHYRQAMGRDAKMAVVAMQANEFSVADPRDHREMDFVGFDSSAPGVLAQFSKGAL